MSQYRTSDWIKSPTLISDDKISEIARIIPRETPRTPEYLTGAYVHFLLGGFMGLPWVNEHVYKAVRESRADGRFGFFEGEISDDISRERKTQRIFDLAEMLMNLQTTPGFLFFFKRFREIHPNQFESAYAELQIAKMLFATGYPFRFVRAAGEQKREDYDFEIMFPDGTIACIEAKCRLESETISADAVVSKLSKARRQLPKGAPGIILFKVPQHWFVSREIGAQLRAVALDFLRRTTSVVSVKFYVSVVGLDPVRKSTSHRHAYDEITNNSTKWPARNWNLFAGNEHRPNWKWLVNVIEEAIPQRL